jgi:hypothetical protein
VILLQPFDVTRGLRLNLSEGREEGAFRIPQVFREPSHESVGIGVKGFLGKSMEPSAWGPPESAQEVGKGNAEGLFLNAAEGCAQSTPRSHWPLQTLGTIA